MALLDRLGGWLGSPREAGDAGPPLFFFHIPKTAGTSAAAAMRTLFPRRAIITTRGVLSRPMMERAIARGLPPGGLIYGHVDHGVGALLRGRTRMVTLLRDPVEHCVSNYLFIRGDPNNPQVREARRLGFADFLRTYPYHGVFQAASLDVGLHDAPPASLDALLDRLPAVQAFLEEMFLVGTVGGLEGFLATLAAAVGQPAPPLRRLRRGKGRSEEQARLREERRALEHDPALAPYLAAERAMYEAACRLEARWRDALPGQPPRN